MNELSDIEILRVSHRYRKQVALRDVSARIQVGLTGLLGPNGAGKSTLLSLIATALPLQSGNIYVAAADVSTSEGRRRTRKLMGYLPQNFELIGSMTVQDAVEYAAWAQGVEDTNCNWAARKSLDTVELGDVAKRRVRTLSGGQRQRLGIAAALSHDPRVLILDEPTSGLDPEQRARIRSYLRHLARDRVVLLSTHILEDVVRSCDWVAVLSDGRIRFQGSRADFAPDEGGAPDDALSPAEVAYRDFVNGA